jgi:hypothetical protein
VIASADLIVIVTCERPGSLVHRTAERLAAAGASECPHQLILSDGWDLDPPPGWDWEVRYPQAGIRVMMWWAFAHALELGAERLIFCEDDITPTRNAIRYLRTVEIPDHVAFIDAHDMKEMRDELAPGLHLVEAPGRDRMGYWGNQCMMFPRRTVEWLAARSPLEELSHMKNPGGELPHAADVVMGRLLEASPWPRWAVLLPRLFRHDGVQSVAHPTKTHTDHRVTANYPGEDFDALTLPPADLLAPF